MVREVLSKVNLIAHKVESHLTVQEAIDKRVPKGWFLANEAADAAAKCAAEEAQVPEHEISLVQWADATGYQIRNRAAGVLKHVIEVDQRAPKPKVGHRGRAERKPRVTRLQKLLQGSQHKVTKGGSKKRPRYTCAVCHASDTNTVIKDWLKKPCVPWPANRSSSSSSSNAAGEATVALGEKGICVKKPQQI